MSTPLPLPLESSIHPIIQFTADDVIPLIRGTLSWKEAHIAGANRMKIDWRQEFPHLAVLLVLLVVAGIVWLVQYMSHRSTHV